MIRWEQTTSRLLQALRLKTIRSKLLAFAVVTTLIPSVSTAWMSYVRNKRALTDQIDQELGGASSQASRELDLWLKERVYDLRIFASSNAVSENLARMPVGPGGALQGSLAQGRLNDYLNSVRDRVSDYEELIVIDPQGRVVATSAKRARPVRLPPEWKTEIQGDDPVLGVPYWDNTVGKAVMVVAVPIHQANGRLLGAFTARLNLQMVDDVLRRYSPREPGRAYLIGATGRLITASHTSSAGLMKEALPRETVQQLLSQEGKAVEYQNYKTESVVGALTGVPRLKWSLIAEIPSTEAYRQANRLRNMSVLIVIGLLVGVGMIAYLLGLVIVRPLDRLTQGAAKVAAGDLSVDLPVVGGGEVGYLTEVFNHMVARLREGRQELERLSITDGLTGLYNRRYLIEQLANEVSRSRRGLHGFAVLMVDVDNFKDYNDTNGHLAGDEVLVRVAAILREATREVDWAARYGGEEFLVLLPETGMDGAVEVAERVRSRLARETFAGGRITVSFGVATFPEFGESPEAVIMSADAALYQAKHEGRNRVVRASFQTS